MGIKIVSRYGNTLKEKLYLPAVISGLKVTFSHFITNLKDTSKIETICYPEQLPKDITSRYRGVHRLKKREDNSIKCVACYMCATACPSECIFIEAVEREDNIDEKMPKKFSIDLLECIFCGACAEACPCDAIAMDTGIFSFVKTKREDFVLDIDILLSHEPMKGGN
ncbi:MAG: NADH-quinone oxidoreductase subunit I [Sulfurospirillum sp.]|nr:NADH-quinone oxidoreductase subunit I [Sulfurospirillum sp.]MBL0702595.1 NADH-quinone oxidoreductase subunit I [Sulfurospirillum sp.]